MKNKKVLIAIILIFAVVAAIISTKALARSSWG
jgi:hypothetical protein